MLHCKKGTLEEPDKCLEKINMRQKLESLKETSQKNQMGVGWGEDSKYRPSKKWCWERIRNMAEDVGTWRMVYKGFSCRV